MIAIAVPRTRSARLRMAAPRLQTHSSNERAPRRLAARVIDTASRCAKNGSPARDHLNRLPAKDSGRRHRIDKYYTGGTIRCKKRAEGIVMSAGKLTEQAKGVYIISATPFTDDGALDLQSVDRLTDFYLGCGVHGFTLLGMMGEAHKLTTEELIEVVKRVIARSGDRQVIVGVSHAGIENVRRLAHEVMIAGAAGVMVAPPAGLKGDDGIYNYYAQVFTALGPDIPVVYQDYPQATGVYLPPGVFERLVDDFRQLVMLKHEDAPGLAKLTRIREGEKKPGRRRVSILVGNGGLHYPQELRRGADGAMTGFAWPEMLVEVYDLFTAGKVEEAEDLFDIYLPLVRHEVQPGIGLALRKEVLFRCGAIKSPKQRAPGSSLTGTDRTELDSLIARLERRLAAAGRRRKVAE